MKKLAVWSPVFVGLLILSVAVGCSKAPETKTDATPKDNQVATTGGDPGAKTNADVPSNPAPTDTKGKTLSPTTPTTPGTLSGPNPNGKPGVTTNVETKKPAVSGAPLSSSATGLVGKYKGDLKMPPAKPGDQRAEMAAKMAKSMAATLALELKADKSFSMTVMFPVEGTWSVSGSTLSLKAEKIMGQTIEQLKEMAKKQPGGRNVDQMNKPMKFKIVNGGKKLTSITEGPQDKGSMTFTKQ